ncbi:MAG: DUF2083 domain-containing protein [Alphaproteobacteria bacterium]|nr:DUF2083 domain-containing protein [Alphaproteobacteria bacterium]
MSQRKVFAGARLRALREEHQITQRELARRLAVSTSYVNQIENNQRPLTASLMLALVEQFGLDFDELMGDRQDRMLADLREIVADPLFAGTAPGLMALKTLSTQTPDVAHALVRLYEAYRKGNERLADMDAAMADTPSGGFQTAYEEVRDFFHYADNYLDPLDRAAETLAVELGADPGLTETRLVAYLAEVHDVTVHFVEPDEAQMLRAFDRQTRTLAVNARLEPPSRIFQLAAQLGGMEQVTLIGEIAAAAPFKSSEATDICRIGLTNYFAGALQMPYRGFLEAAEALGYDLDELAYRFTASLEQVGHRLSTMQRPKARGVPFFFARLDAAGTITKRHSAAPLQFARFGGACPLWNVHSAFEHRGRILRQRAETPDGRRYLFLAWSEEKRLGGYRGPIRRYAYTLGCEIAQASRLVYATDLDLAGVEAFDPIGISCRICERPHCPQRSVPPLTAGIAVPEGRRAVVPYEIK